MKLICFSSFEKYSHFIIPSAEGGYDVYKNIVRYNRYVTPLEIV